MERYAPYLAYNREMAMSFGNPPLTMESRLVPYQYYRFIGSISSLEATRKRLTLLSSLTALALQSLKGTTSVFMAMETRLCIGYAGATDEMLESYAEEIAKYCEIANEPRRPSG